MVKVEKGLAKIKNYKSILFTGILLMLVVFSASYAFFTNSLEGLNKNLGFESGVNVQYILNAESNINFTFNPLHMAEGGSEYLDSTSGTGYVLLGNNSTNETITCEYEIWYKPTQVFTNSTGAENLKELTLIGRDSSGQNTEFEFNVDGISTEQLIKTGYITVTGANNTLTQNWTFNYRHYNLSDINQNNSLGKNIGGQIYFKARPCYEGNYKSA